MAAAVLSSPIFTISNPRPRITRSIPPSAATPFVYNPLSVPAPVSFRSSRGSVSRRLHQVKATTVQEEDEKVNVEDSFPKKTLPYNERETMDYDPGTSDSAMVVSWNVKLEQSINIFLTDTTIKILDSFYSDRHYARFFVLETIARVPYFAFISVLHMYESFGWWRRADYLKVHFAESWNEFHHLLIMEELGGNAFWVDRFLAPFLAFFYYFMTVGMYILSPRMAYHFSECVERHAYSTYDKFIKLQEEELKKLPAPKAAVDYYMNEDLYLFDEFQTSRTPNSRRPRIENLYDTFVNIRDDEAEHCKTMAACQTHGNLHSPHSNSNSLKDDNYECTTSGADCEGIADCVTKSLTSQK
ncbi:ubiquinol oxidase 4, chloroplastic/chromoplastic [Canna indica]|uniref:Ubiquinol oxidase n=1 Tax=Canna indica TaxID=4628 RepID=A0AAQ3K4I2_9LILI|nr:ubiquinol oxidase 4, chloroplastic/chromoplastic [Canna indica]